MVAGTDMQANSIPSELDDRLTRIVSLSQPITGSNQECTNTPEPRFSRPTAVARVAGIQAAKRTQELIPMCHTLALDCVKVDFEAREEDDLMRYLHCRH